MSDKTLTDVIRGYRELADFLEAHQANLPQGAEYYNVCNNGVSCQTAAELANVLRTGGSWKKDFSSVYAFVTREFAGGVRFWAATDRNLVCERIVIGTTVIPAQPERIVDNVEWRCADPMLAAHLSEQE